MDQAWTSQVDLRQQPTRKHGGEQPPPAYYDRQLIQHPSSHHPGNSPALAAFSRPLTMSVTAQNTSTNSVHAPYPQDYQNLVGYGFYAQNSRLPGAIPANQLPLPSWPRHSQSGASVIEPAFVPTSNGHWQVPASVCPPEACYSSLAGAFNTNAYGTMPNAPRTETLELPPHVRQSDTTFSEHDITPYLPLRPSAPMEHSRTLSIQSSSEFSFDHNPPITSPDLGLRRSMTRTPPGPASPSTSSLATDSSLSLQSSVDERAPGEQMRVVATPAVRDAAEARRHREGRFECTVTGCGANFTTRHNLRGHLRSHTGEKPYICRFRCGKRFGRQSDCHRHEETVHRGSTDRNVAAVVEKSPPSTRVSRPSKRVAMKISKDDVTMPYWHL